MQVFLGLTGTRPLTAHPSSPGGCRDLREFHGRGPATVMLGHLRQHRPCLEKMWGLCQVFTPRLPAQRDPLRAEPGIAF